MSELVCDQARHSLAIDTVRCATDLRHLQPLARRVPGICREETAEDAIRLMLACALLPGDVFDMGHASRSRARDHRIRDTERPRQQELRDGEEYRQGTSASGHEAH